MKTLVSNRGIPLLTQRTHDKYTLLTVEKYCKWYNIYKINPNGEVSEFDYKEYPDLMKNNLFTLFHDHSVVPVTFVNIAQKLNYKFDIQTYYSILIRYFHDIELDGVFGSQDSNSIIQDILPSEDDLLDRIIDDELIIFK